MTTVLQACLYGTTIVIFAIGIWKKLEGARDPQQPKVVPAIIPIPVFGHVIGLLLHRNDYYTKISQRWNLPIISLSMFGGNVHVIKSAELIYSLQRQPKNISFWFFEGQFSAKLSGMTKPSTHATMANIGPDSSGPSIVIDGLKLTRDAMSLQGGLLEMSRVASTVMTEAIDKLAKDATRRIDMFAWVQHEITVATTEAVYGPANPYRDPGIESDFWEFADSIMTIMLPPPIAKLVARKGLAARDRVVQAIGRYYASDAHLNASELSKTRYISMKGHIADEDMPRSEVVNGIAILANSAPTAFWAMYHIFSDSELLAEVRKQVDGITTVTINESGLGQIRSINMGALKDAPILSSLIYETLRYRARGTGPRMVLEDSVLTDGTRDYHLKKDSVVMIAHNAMHLDRAFWGETAEDFDAKRFLPGNKVPLAAFRGFGGGANMCPGKTFAMTEIAGFLALLAVRFDINPVDGSWVEPGQDMSNPGRENTPPLRKVMIEVTPRPSSEGVQWKLEV